MHAEAAEYCHTRYLSYHYDMEEHEAPISSSSGIPKSMARTCVVP